jgi:hypothetical protein
VGLYLEGVEVELVLVLADWFSVCSDWGIVDVPAVPFPPAESVLEALSSLADVGACAVAAAVAEDEDDFKNDSGAIFLHCDCDCD